MKIPKIGPLGSVCILAVILVLSCGCLQQEQSAAEDDVKTVVVTIPPQIQFAEKIGGDRVRVICMVPPGANPHTYEPTPGQLQEIGNAAMYAKVGSGIEFERTWMDKITGINPDMLIVDCSKGVGLIDDTGAYASENGTLDEQGADPHIWSSPRNAAIMVENIYEGLILLDPENQEYYLENKEKYLDELADLDMEIREALAGKEGMKILVFHPAWGYLAHDYNLEQVPIEQGGKEPTPRGVENVILQAEEYNITVIFASPEFSTRSAEVIATEIGGEVVLISPLEQDYLNNMRAVALAFAGSASI